MRSKLLGRARGALIAGGAVMVMMGSAAQVPADFTLASPDIANGKKIPEAQIFNSIRMQRSEHFSGLVLEQRSCRDQELRAAGARSRCAHRERLVALDCLQHSGGRHLAARGCRRPEETLDARRDRPGAHRLRIPRLWGSVPAARQAAPLLFSTVCAKSTEARCARRRDGCAHRL